MNIRVIAMVGGLVALAGCTVPTNDEINQQATNVGNNVKTTAHAAVTVVQSNTSEAVDHLYNLDEAAKEDLYGTMDHIAGWMRPDKPKPNQPIAATYCYHMYEDIACYRSPMPGWENRLVGYQGTGAAPPPVAVMEPLPQHQADASKLPENRAKDAQPVFAAPPSKAKDEKSDDSNAPITTDSSHEQLTDPALAPQL